MTGQTINSLGGTLFIIKRPPQEALATVYIRLKQEGQLERVWYSRPTSLLDVLQWAALPNNITYAGCFQKTGSDQVELCGIGWINEVTALGVGKYRGEVGMAFLREWQHDNIPLELCSMMIEDGFTHEGLDVVFGTTPVKNPAAIRFVKKIGFREVGTAPRFVSWKGEPCDALISCVTKEEWFGQRACPDSDMEAA